MTDYYNLLLSRYIAGEASEQETKDLVRWLEADSENKRIFQQSLLAWNTVTDDFSSDIQPDVDIAWAQVKNSINTPKIIDLKEKRKEGLWFMKIAASLIILISSAFLIRNLISNRQNEIVASYITGAGEKTQVILPDSSKVWLNKNSSLSYQKDFNEINRIVTITGEAFFEVTRNEEKPFIVKAKNCAARVLGTAFDIRDNENDNTSELMVEHGKVAFSSEHSEVILEKGYAGSLNRKNGELIKQLINDPNVFAWKSNRLVFENIPFAKVDSTLEKYFSISIETKTKEINNYSFTGTFESPNLEDVLKVLSVTLNLEYKKNNNKIIFSETQHLKSI